MHWKLHIWMSHTDTLYWSRENSLVLLLDVETLTLHSWWLSLDLLLKSIYGPFGISYIMRLYFMTILLDMLLTNYKANIKNARKQYFASKTSTIAFYFLFLFMFFSYNVNACESTASCKMIIIPRYCNLRPTSLCICQK